MARGARGKELPRQNKAIHQLSKYLTGIPNAIQKWGIFEVKRLRFELGEAGAEGAIYLKTK